MRPSYLTALIVIYLSSRSCFGKQRPAQEGLGTVPSFAKISESGGKGRYKIASGRIGIGLRNMRGRGGNRRERSNMIMVGDGKEEENILVSPPSNNHLRKNIFIMINVLGSLALAYVVFVDTLQTWHEKFRPNLATNWFSISLVLSSKTVIITGLLILCIYAVYCPKVYSIEHLGLGLLTVGPLLSICSILSWKDEPGASIVNQKGDLVSEFLEFIGMIILDFSQIPDSRVSSLLSDVCGYTTLLASALLSFENVQFNAKWWGISMKIFDHVLLADVLGLLSLMGFSVFLFHEKGVAERLRNRNIFQVIRDYVFDVPPSHYQGSNLIDYIFAG